MNAYFWIGLVLLFAGTPLILRNPLMLPDEPAPRRRRRERERAIGQALAAVGAIVMNVGTVVSDAPIVVKVFATAGVFLLLAVLVWTTAARLKQQHVEE
jgi:hypothetical protein